MTEKHNEPVLKKTINDGEGRYINEISPSSEKIIDAEMEKNKEVTKKNHEEKSGGRGSVVNEAISVGKKEKNQSQGSEKSRPSWQDRTSTAAGTTIFFT